MFCDDLFRKDRPNKMSQVTSSLVAAVTLHESSEFASSNQLVRS